MGGVYSGGNVRASPAHVGLQNAQQQAGPSFTPIALMPVQLPRDACGLPACGGKLQGLGTQM